MKRILAPFLVAGLGLALLSGVSEAGQNRNAKIVLHLPGGISKGSPCVRLPSCSSITTNGSLYPRLYFAYLLVTDGHAGAGIGGLQCGIAYPGGTSLIGGNAPINIFSWMRCATLEFTSTGWPAPGGGNLITWDTNTKCQRIEPGGSGTGAVANAGYFYLAAYAPGRLAVTTRPLDGLGRVADCSSNEDIIASGTNDFRLGYVEFSAGGATPGYNPCGSFQQIYCHVLGPTSVAAGQAGIVYTVNPSEITPEGYWLISGNVVIDQSDNTSATVHATGPGTFNIGYQVGIGCVEGCGCGLEVTVNAPTAVMPSSWSRIKAMYPGSK